MARKELIKALRPHVNLYRDPKSGIAWIEDGTSGTGHSCHPNISASGSVRGMKAKGYWYRNDRTVRSHGFIYNIDRCVIHSPYDEIANDYCRCGGVHREGR